MRVLKPAIKNSIDDPTISWDPWVLDQLKQLPMTQQEAQCFLKKDLNPKTAIFVGIDTPADEIQFLNPNVTYSSIWMNLYEEPPCSVGPPTTKRAKMVSTDTENISDESLVKMWVDIVRVPQMSVLLSGPSIFVQQTWSTIPKHLNSRAMSTASSAASICNDENVGAETSGAKVNILSPTLPLSFLSPSHLSSLSPSHLSSLSPSPPLSLRLLVKYFCLRFFLRLLVKYFCLRFFLRLLVKYFC